MSEGFAWPEGQIYIWTGTATASATPAYAVGIVGVFKNGWENFSTFDGEWHNNLSAQRTDISIDTLFTVDNSALPVFAANTAAEIHIKFNHTVLGVSAGYVMHSGRIDSTQIAGRDDDMFRYRINYHCNKWSAY